MEPLTPARVDADVILGHAFDLKLDVRAHAKTQADNTDARQIAADTRDAVLRALHEIDAGFDAIVPGGMMSTSSVMSGRCCARTLPAKTKHQRNDKCEQM